MASDRPTPETLPREPMARLLAVMAWLRDRRHGCPWDIDQTFRTIAPYTIEEAYEVADAIERDDLAALKEELGDLLLQVVYHAQMASEAGAFGFADVAAGDRRQDGRPPSPCVRRRPDRHGRGPDRVLGSPQGGRARGQGSKEAAAGTLDGVARALPALLRAEKIQKRAAAGRLRLEDRPDRSSTRSRRSWASCEPSWRPTPSTRTRLTDEMGDVLFAVANLARHCKVDPEAALRATNDKFERRFRHIERRLAEVGPHSRPTPPWRRWKRSGRKPRRAVVRPWAGPPAAAAARPRSRSRSSATASRRGAVIRPALIGLGRLVGRPSKRTASPPASASIKRAGGMVPGLGRR